MSRTSPGSAKDRALRLLAVRWRSRAELRWRLLRAGFDELDVEMALDDLEQADLVDDRRFAAELVRDRASRRLAGLRAIRAELRGKGVSQDVAEEALAGLEQEEESRAFHLALSRAPRLDPAQPEAALRRLVSLLVRRGYPPEVAHQAARRALAPGAEPGG